MALHQSASTESGADTAAQLRIRWQFMHSRRNVLKQIDECIHRLYGLQYDLGADEIEPLLSTYCNARTVLESIGAGESPPDHEITEFAKRLKELHQELLAIAAAKGIAPIPVDSREFSGKS